MNEVLQRCRLLFWQSGLCLVVAVLLIHPALAWGALDPDEVIAPKESTTTEVAPLSEGIGSETVTNMVMGLLLLAGVAIAAIVWMKRRPGAVLASAGHLQIVETRMLGNRQFLVVVDHAGQRMLLGVGPGFITNLGPLEGPPDTFPETEVGG